MTEVQRHGLDFEKWVRDSFFSQYVGVQGQEWDVPAENNCHPKVPEAFRGIPVSIKSKKFKNSIELGDILRQRAIDCTFLMIVGFWQQRTPREKWIVDIGVCLFKPSAWNSLWGSLKLSQIRQIDAVVKDSSSHYSVRRERAQTWKRTTPEVQSSSIVVNPKIDSKRQRRIQCSLPFSVFWQHVGREAQQSDAPSLFSLPFPNPLLSEPRKFKRK